MDHNSEDSHSDRFSSLEDKLRGLVPPAISEAGQERLENTVDQLVGEKLIPFYRSNFWRAAAVVTLSSALVWSVFKSNELNQPDVSTALVSVNSPAPMELLTSTNRIDGRQDDGLIVPTDGRAPHYRYRYSVTDEERVRDPETGTIVTLRQPRQEIITVPVTQF